MGSGLTFRHFRRARRCGAGRENVGM